MNKYKIIYADPPWQYSRKTGNGAAENHYSTMSMDELSALWSDVQSMSDQDTVLVMWTTGPLLPEALSIMQDWGFSYKTILFNWVKYNPESGKFPIGGGSYTRAGSELCLLGVKDTIPERYSHAVRQVMLSPPREHSRKPDLVRQHLVTLFGDVPRIELFARETVRGWDQFGNETDKFNQQHISPASCWKGK